jgi:hypothetical protein
MGSIAKRIPTAWLRAIVVGDLLVRAWASLESMDMVFSLRIGRGDHRCGRFVAISPPIATARADKNLTSCLQNPDKPAICL